MEEMLDSNRYPCDAEVQEYVDAVDAMCSNRYIMQVVGGYETKSVRVRELSSIYSLAFSFCFCFKSELQQQFV